MNSFQEQIPGSVPSASEALFFEAREVLAGGLNLTVSESFLAPMKKDLRLLPLSGEKDLDQNCLPS